MWICIAPCCEHISKALRYGTHSQGISQFYLHTPHSSANGMNHTCLCLPSLSWYSFTDPGGMEGLVGLGWLVGTYWNRCPAPGIEPDTVTHLSTNRVWRRLTSLLKANALTTTPDHQRDCQQVWSVGKGHNSMLWFTLCGWTCSMRLGQTGSILTLSYDFFNNYS